MLKLQHALIGTLLCQLALPAAAYQANDVIIRFGPAWVEPHSQGQPDLVKADGSLGLGVSMNAMIHDRLGIELLGATPFKHEIHGRGSLQGVKVGSVRQLPPTVLLNYYPLVSEHFQPFVGVGYNHTIFYDERTDGALNSALGGPTQLSLKNSRGPAFEAGLDIPLSEDWMLSLVAWRLDIDTTATVTANGTTAAVIDLSLDPWVYMIGMGKRF